MNHQNPSRSSRIQRKQVNHPFQNNQIQNDENTSEQIRAQMETVIVEGIEKFYLGSMEEEIDEDPTEELCQEPEDNNGQHDEELNEFSQEAENNEENEEFFGVNVEIIISADDACFDSSSHGMEEEIMSESDERPHDPASTAESGDSVYLEEIPKTPFPYDPYDVKMRELKDKKLEEPVDFEKELGESKVWKELTEKKKSEVEDFLIGYNMNGKTRGFLGRAFDLALSMDFRSSGILKEQDEAKTPSNTQLNTNMDMNDNTSISQESSYSHHPLAMGPQDNQMRSETSNTIIVSQGRTLFNDGGYLNTNIDMNENIPISQESRPEVNPPILFGYQVNQMRNENSNIILVPQGRTLFNDGGFQQFVVNGLAPGFAYRGRTSSRGNASTACSLSPTSKVPQSPINNNMLARLPSTKSTMSVGQMLDYSSEDEESLNEFQEKNTKSPKHMDDVNGQEGHAGERENTIEMM